MKHILSRFFVTSADSLSNCPVIQLLTVDIWNIGPFCEHKYTDAFSIHW